MPKMVKLWYLWSDGLNLKIYKINFTLYISSVIEQFSNLVIDQEQNIAENLCEKREENFQIIGDFSNSDGVNRYVAYDCKSSKTSLDGALTLK